MKEYKDIRSHGPDFIVSYRLYTPEEGGRKTTYQHLRCDFMYEGDDPTDDGIYMIHPEFLDGVGHPLAENVAVPLSGTASMWILSPEMRASIHRRRVKIGVRGHFMEGPRKIGDLTIEEIAGLNTNAAV